MDKFNNYSIICISFSVIKDNVCAKDLMVPSTYSITSLWNSWQTLRPLRQEQQVPKNEQNFEREIDEIASVFGSAKFDSFNFELRRAE